MGRDAFMKLLVHQLQNQDPLEPMDAREMVTQLSELTSVEQLVSIEQRLGHLEIATAGIGNTQAAGLVGRTVVANADRLSLGDTGPARGAFVVEGSSATTEITIRDAAGDVVRTISLGGQTPGTHVYEWDGNGENGERLPAGRYEMTVVAKDAEGHPVTTSTRIEGRVARVTYENGYPELVVGEATVMLGDVLSISE
jgi:flagellar basal-body rod modification protein FlgD